MTDTQQYTTEAAEVAAQERARRPRYAEERKRISLHINFAPDEESEMLYYQAFRGLPHGLSKRVVVKFMDILVGSCPSAEEARNILYHWTRARDETARMAMTGGAPPQWREAPMVRSSPEAALAQRAIPYQEFVREQMRAPPPGYRLEMVPTGEGPTQPAPQAAPPAPAPESQHVTAPAPGQQTLGGVMNLQR